MLTTGHESGAIGVRGDMLVKGRQMPVRGDLVFYAGGTQVFARARGNQTLHFTGDFQNK